MIVELLVPILVTCALEVDSRLALEISRPTPIERELGISPKESYKLVTGRITAFGRFKNQWYVKLGNMWTLESKCEPILKVTN